MHIMIDKCDKFCDYVLPVNMDNLQTIGKCDTFLLYLFLLLLITFTDGYA